MSAWTVINERRVDAVLMHLDAPAPTDFRRVRELLLAAVDAIDR